MDTLDSLCRSNVAILHDLVVPIIRLLCLWCIRQSVAGASEHVESRLIEEPNVVPMQIRGSTTSDGHAGIVRISLLSFHVHVETVVVAATACFPLVSLPAGICR